MRDLKFGKWTVGEQAANENGFKRYHCTCECGNISIIRGTSLRYGNTTQCVSCSGKTNGRKGLDSQCKNDLYLVSCAGYIKVGSADDVTKRLRSMRVNNPFPITLEYVGVNQGCLEPSIHAAFREYHHHGEWFKLTSSEALAHPSFTEITTS